MGAVQNLEYRTYSQARDHFKEVLDAAERGLPVGVQRREQRVALIDAEDLRTILASSRNLSRPVAVAEAGGWTIFLSDAPIAVDAAGFDEAVEEFIQALREYAEDWISRLSNVPNHARHWVLAQFVSHSSDDQLADWVRGDSD